MEETPVHVYKKCWVVCVWLHVSYMTGRNRDDAL